MVDPKAEELELSIAGRDFTIRQSPGVLQSNREGGTTGATVWRACVHFAEWLGSSNNALFEHGIVDSSSVVLELGSGISGLVPSMLSPKVGRVVATDQQYAMKVLRDNVNANIASINPKPNDRRASKKAPQDNKIEILALDWETDDINGFFRSNGLETGVDVVLACDCIFNYALIGPLVQACVNICKVRLDAEPMPGSDHKPPLCVITQQLRQPDVFEQWLLAFMAAFHVWRVPSDMLNASLKEGSGFIVHVGILRKG